ncbi:MAG: GNAT family N-acetyltransferase [Clostridia bacterium]|nr:GNAT family N-acetyltransferase [Clostridia bacterium]
MAQLKMYWLPGFPVPDPPLPEGYSFSHPKTLEDKLAWCECCKNGLSGEEGLPHYVNEIENRASDGLVPERDVFFLDYKGEHVGTVTAYVNKDNHGDVHMVGIRTEYRGRGLAKYLSSAALKKLSAENPDFVFLTTNEWRVSAVKSYLSAGFLPVEYDVGMEERWADVLETYGIDSIQMLNEDATPFKIIYRRGLWKK